MEEEVEQLYVPRNGEEELISTSTTSYIVKRGRGATASSCWGVKKGGRECLASRSASKPRRGVHTSCIGVRDELRRADQFNRPMKGDA